MIICGFFKFLVNCVKLQVFIRTDPQVWERISFGMSYDGWIVAEFVTEEPATASDRATYESKKWN